MAFLDSALQDAEQSLPPSPAQSSSNAETPTDSAGHGAVSGSAEWLDEVVPAHPLLTVGVVDVDAACARLESLGWATVASPAVSARDPPAEMGLRPDEDSALTAAVVQDACGVQLELIGGFEAPRIASVWAQPPSTERCKVRLCRAASMHALNPLSAPGHPAPLHLTFTAHPAETSIALLGRDAARVRDQESGGHSGQGRPRDADVGDDHDSAGATARAHGWAWLQGLAGELLPGQSGDSDSGVASAGSQADGSAADREDAAAGRLARAGVAMVEVGLRSEGLLEACDAAERLASEGALAGILTACGPAGEGLSADARAALGLGGGEGDPALSELGQGSEGEGFPAWVVAGEGGGDVSVLMRGEEQVLGPSAHSEDAGRPAVMGR
ncbi:hypothetical protein FNF31_03149 [Cafeteria roenbergensis]|nr:hypothetical protein FNF31_03149 [Cafeteria roenbergensis]